MSEQPFVSLCTPTYNRRKFISLAIRCVEMQDYPKDKMEWIIVNDGDEEIEDILNEAVKTRDLPEIKYYRYDKKIEYIGEKRNICNKYCSGDIIINIDDDDYYPPERVSNAVNTLNENPNIYCVGVSKTFMYFRNYNIMGALGPWSNNHCCTGSLAFRKELLNITSYDNKRKTGEDKAFLLDYNLPVIQLDTLKTIIVLSHNYNSSNNINFAIDKDLCLMKGTIENYIDDKICLDIMKIKV